MKECREEREHWDIANAGIICNAFELKSNCAAMVFSLDFEEGIQIHLHAPI